MCQSGVNPLEKKIKYNYQRVHMIFRCQKYAAIERHSGRY